MGLRDLIERLKDITKPWNTRVYWQTPPNGSLFPLVVVRDARISDVAFGDDKNLGMYVTDITFEFYCTNCDGSSLALEFVQYLEEMPEVLRIASIEDVSELGADIRCWRIIARAVL